MNVFLFVERQNWMGGDLDERREMREVGWGREGLSNASEVEGVRVEQEEDWGRKENGKKLEEIAKNRRGGEIVDSLETYSYVKIKWKDR
ncbi:uncharacterized protein EAF01_000906 [Botrytis porri]|uniref:Uncharacterized protein n=1 Tax=Botrytis porri TaxID=87229 RepID=A0A4Z1K4I8_9HELO|nr:uncharacterized protein EAF01_000906 [Botrytis porri]KAF7914500.1 hypothetical protein EAF01_000906 [Botrytis porri]TGO80815.1 hypothetical protein BPOR_1689g00010 [Botrytis porri]